MKIKNQLRLFMTLIVIIPVIAIITFPIHKKVIESNGVSFDLFFLISLIITIFFEFLCILFTIHVSRTISKSITFLQKATKKLAEGEVDHTLERRKNNRGTNEITDLIVNLEKMRLALREDDERRTRFIMGMSHDLRTPVAVIKGYLEAIQDGIVSEPEDIQKSINILYDKTSHLEIMINSLISFVKLETNNWKENLFKQPFYPVLNEFAESCINTGIIFKRKVSAKIQISQDIEVIFNKELFVRAMENLFSNALRYTKEQDAITITAEETDKEITIGIEDSGIGINEKDIQYIFDIFYRASNSRQEPGHGIGLSVVKNIIQTHGWKIDVKSQIGVGTVFIITIPKKNSAA